MAFSYFGNCKLAPNSYFGVLLSQSHISFAAELKHLNSVVVGVDMLTARVLEKARRELGEDAVKREECLCQFRDWISDHNFIKSCRRGELTTSVSR